MLGIPDMYKVNKKFDVKTFITADLKPNEKKRLKETVLDIILEYQMAGEAVPSLISEEYDCQAILFFGIKLCSIKDASFVSSIIQKLGKPLYVIRLYDHSGMECYSFAHKRLNIQDKTLVVIEDLVLSLPTSQHFDDDINLLVKEFTAYEKIRNKADKLSMYLEMMVKVYIISNMLLWSETKALLQSTIWYNSNDVLKAFKLLRKIELLKKEQKSAMKISEKAKINTELKEIYENLEKMI
jgi:hypothetical protein